MQPHSIIVRLNTADTELIPLQSANSRVVELRLIDGKHRIKFGIGQMLNELALRGIRVTETAIDLAIIAATVTAADTRISRRVEAQDSWTREIDLYIPVADPEIWSGCTDLLERMLRFLTGDLWHVRFRARVRGMEKLVPALIEKSSPAFTSVALFSGGLDSFIGAIDLLASGERPLFVSHYRDASTKSQAVCASYIGNVYGDLSKRHVRANIGFDKGDMPGTKSETTTRGRSFIFFALASLAASALEGETHLHVPENGLISLNIPLDPLRLGAWSTRTTHPFYMKRWQDLVDRLGMGIRFVNPYRFKTKGEMVGECRNQDLLRTAEASTISCSSVGKARWKGRAPIQCGYCTPCIIRRAAIRAAHNVDPTTYLMDDLTGASLSAKRAESKDVRAFQLMSHRLTRMPNVAAVIVHKTGPLVDYSIDEVHHYSQVFKRGIEEVGKFVNTINVRM